MHCHIITNNPQVAARYPDAAQYREASVSDIFLAVRDAVHLGATLISHPLAGSVKPNENPYRSVAIAPRRGPVDPRSLALAEGAIETLRKLGRKERAYDARALEDFQVIDLDLMHSAMQALPVRDAIEG